MLFIAHTVELELEGVVYKTGLEVDEIVTFERVVEVFRVLGGDY